MHFHYVKDHLNHMIHALDLCFIIKFNLYFYSVADFVKTINADL